MTPKQNQGQWWIQKIFSINTCYTLFLSGFAFMKIPMLFFARPSVVELSEFRAVIKIALRRRTKNHLGSMYFGALCAGADCAAGLHAMKQARNQPARISLIFKDLKAEFLKRAEGDVYFYCNQGLEIADLVTVAAQSGERVQMPIHIEATVPDLGDDPVAKFTLTLSLKKEIP